MKRYVTISNMKMLGYSITEIDNMIPFEIDLYSDLEKRHQDK